MSQALSTYEQQLNQEKMPAGKKKVLLAALHLFAANGFHATTTAGIAKQAGVSEGTIYKYFSSKEDLLGKLLTPILTEIRDNFITRLDGFSSLEEFISFVVDDRLQFGHQNADLLKLLLQELLVDPEIIPSFKEVLGGPHGILTTIEKIKRTYPEINQDLTAAQIIRTVIGPLFVLVSQENFLPVSLPVTATDIAIARQQIIAGLTS